LDRRSWGVKSPVYTVSSPVPHQDPILQHSGEAGVVRLAKQPESGIPT
jgi:hypothetical protein